MAYIEMKNSTKLYRMGSTTITANDNVSFTIEQGELAIILGASGAGKSTVLNILGGMDTNTSGQVIIDGKDISNYTPKQLTAYRRTDIGFVFQFYNLVANLTARENVELASQIVPDAQDARQALADVGLADRVDNFPAQLSGGEQQRVAIARAVAKNPKILLCDEATSALDPTTTKEILKLLQDINKQYGITIVIITHEMAVVQEICSHVAIIDAGELAEHGTVEEVFSRPQSQAARKLVFMVDPKAKEMSGKRCIRIVFTENSSFEPVIANMVLECKAPVNILLADTKDIGGIAHGQMILQLPEDEMAANKMVHYLQERKLEVEELRDYVG